MGEKEVIRVFNFKLQKCWLLLLINISYKSKNFFLHNCWYIYIMFADFKVWRCNLLFRPATELYFIQIDLILCTSLQCNIIPLYTCFLINIRFREISYNLPEHWWKLCQKIASYQGDFLVYVCPVILYIGSPALKDR